MQIRYILLTLFVFIVTFSLVSCLEDALIENPGIHQEETDVRLTITTPGSSLPKAASYLLTNPEYTISDIRILVFNKNENRFKYMAEGQQINSNESNPQITNFTARLKSSEQPVRLVFVANAKELFDTYTPALNATEEEVRSRIQTFFSGQNPTLLPMYGEKELTSLDATKVNTIQLSMLRSVARVDVETELETDKSYPFILESVHIYRANEKVQIMPEPSAWANAEALKVIAPSIPAEPGAQQPYSKQVSTAGDTFIEKLYLPESASLSDPDSQQKKATCVVVGGYFNGQNRPTYYRIDFNSGLEGHPFGQVLRNHLYQFKIKQVTGAGWENPDEAANNRSTTIVAEIRTWENFTTEMYVNGDNYLGVSSRNLNLNYTEGSQKSIYVQSTVPYTIAWAGSSETTTLGASPVVNEYFSATIEPCPDIAPDVSRITYTALQENNTGQPFLSAMTVEWANWVFTINVKQLQHMANVKTSIRVLSVFYGTSGNLGSTIGHGDGSGMRAILSNPAHFSPRGTIDYFSGFTFYQSPAMSTFQNANGTNDTSYEMLSLLYGCDVLYLANDNRLSAWSAGKVMEWLNESPHRVLIVGADAPLTSPNLIRSDYGGVLAGDADWWYNANHVDPQSYHVKTIGGLGASGVSIPATDTKNKLFTDGPLGKVSTNRTAILADGYFGYATSYTSDIIPLMVHTNNKEYMIAGINKKRRIIYHGDASLFQPYPMGGSTGVLANDNAILWANIWAWIAHQVIWGEEAPE